MNKLINIIKMQYGIDCTSIEERPGGWSALAYRVSDGFSDYFLKVYDKNRASTQRLTSLIDIYIPILLRFNKNPKLFGKVPTPLLTMTKQTKFEDEEGVYLLYWYIDGETIGDKALTNKQVEQLSDIISAIHSFSISSFTTNAADLIEDFSLPFLDPLKNILIDEVSVPTDLNRLLAVGKEMLLRLMSTTQALSVTLQQNPPAMLLCHTDIHGWNLMYNDDCLILVDWEGLKIAPPEADMMFIIDHAYSEEFLQTYRKIHPDYIVDQNALAFYKSRRKLEDIWEFIEQLLYDTGNKESRAETLAYLEKEIRTMTP